ncbi:MAG TPA: ATP phosphoribosyltransferase regulatory subunit, partial [Pyrinomonadaceae bacterium]
VLQAAGLGDETHDSALIALDKFDKIGRSGVENEFGERGINLAIGEKLLDFFSALAGLDHAAEVAVGEDTSQKRKALNGAIIGRLVEFVGDNELGARGIDELRSILKFAEAEGIGSRIEIDPSLARGLSYYTGAIMEINVKDLPGSLGGGGRYDNLVGMFLGEAVPACGFSLGLERIIVVMSEREMFPNSLLTSPADVLVSLWDEPSRADSVALAHELREAGLRVDLYPEVDKIGKQFKYASAREIPFVAILGDDERAQGEVALKDMRSGEQQRVKRESVAEEITEKL